LARLRKGSVVTPTHNMRFNSRVTFKPSDIGIITGKDWGNSWILYKGEQGYVWDARLRRLNGRLIHHKCKKCLNACKRGKSCEFFELNPEW